MIGVVHGDGSVGGGHHDVLEPHAPTSGDVDAGLDAEGVTGFERQAVAADHVRVLVSVHADAVTGAVDEVLAVSGGVDHVTCGTVDLLARCADRGGAHTGGLGLLQHRVRLGDVSGHGSEVDAPRDVAAVAVHRSTEVAQHDLAASDDPRSRVVVRTGRVLTGGHDGEVHDVVALGQQTRRDVGRNLRLGASDQSDVAGV